MESLPLECKGRLQRNSCFSKIEIVGAVPQKNSTFVVLYALEVLKWLRKEETRTNSCFVVPGGQKGSLTVRLKTVELLVWRSRTTAKSQSDPKEQLQCKQETGARP